MRIQDNSIANFFIRRVEYELPHEREWTFASHYDFVVFITEGVFTVSLNDVERVVSAPCTVPITAKTLFWIRSETPNCLLFYVHVLRDPDGSGNLLDTSQYPTRTNLRFYAHPLLIGASQ